MAGGIYSIVNKVNGRTYIGRTNNFQQRRSDHLSRLRRGVHYAKYFQKDFWLYGELNFDFKLINECHSEKEAEELEQKYISELKPFYNQSNGGNSNKGYKYSGEAYEAVVAHCRKLAEANRGIPRTDEVKRKVSINNVNRIHLSQETIDKIVNMRREEYPYSKIGKEIGHDPNLVKRVLRENAPELLRK